MYYANTTLCQFLSFKSAEQKHVPKDDFNYIAEWSPVLHCYCPTVRKQLTGTINESVH